jgi:hypothetical protein
MKIHKTIFLCFILILSGCKEIEEESNEDELHKIEIRVHPNIGRDTFILFYNGSEYYCFYNLEYQQKMCLPKTEDIKINVLEKEGITNYTIENITKEQFKLFTLG